MQQEPPNFGGRTTRSGFSLSEVLVAVTVVSAIGGTSILGLTQLNNQATMARLQTCASTVAQSKLDRFLSVSPFQPEVGKIATDAVIGVVEEGTSEVPSVAIYRDPSDPTTRVNGWTVTRISDASSTFGGEKVWAHRCEVTVAYHYRGKPYWVRMSTVRAAE